MCGIAGRFVPQGAAREALCAPVERMSASLAHRGPDGDGLWTDGTHCALGHRRLAVIDLSSAAAQPMAHASGRWVATFNGELYNYRELRAELEAAGERFLTRSDTEVLLAAFATWGTPAFERFDGMYAVAIYDRVERVLTLARDPAGEKPLFYARHAQGIHFASELRSLEAGLGERPGLSSYGLYCYLALRYVPAPDTLLEGVRSLEAGRFIQFDRDGGAVERAHFAFDRVVDPLPRDRREVVDEIEEALAAAVERRFAADVPLGAFLSGGIDSGLVCALAARRAGREIRTYCAGFEGGGEDEVGQASAVARALGLPFESLRLSSSDLVAAIPAFGERLPEPVGDRGAVPTYLLSREMRRHVTVALSGDGGDELFCGYRRYAAMPGAFASPHERIRRYLAERLPVLDPGALDRLFPAEAARFHAGFLDAMVPAAARATWSDAQRFSVVDFHSYLPGAVLAKVDRMSMQHALEVRTPFLSRDVMRAAAALPAALCGEGSPGKPVLREILARYLPASCIAAGKTGFGMPPSFMQAHARVFESAFADAVEALRAHAFFRDRDGLADALAGAARANVNGLWAVTVLGQWVRAGMR